MKKYRCNFEYSYDCKYQSNFTTTLEKYEYNFEHSYKKIWFNFIYGYGKIYI